MAYEITIPEEDTAGFGDYLDALRRRKTVALAIAAVLLVAGSLGVFFWPNAYTSTAVILIEDPEVPPGLVPTTVTTFASRQVQFITQRVMTRSNLASIIEKFDLYADKREYLPTLLLVQDAQNDMTIDVIDVQTADPGTGRPITSTIAFTLGFTHEQPETARKVANELVSLYLAENVRSRTEQTAETSQFLQVEVDRLDKEVKELEAEIATLKRDNEGSLPELMSFNMQVIERLQNEMLEIDRQIQAIAQSKAILDGQLASLNPVANTILPDGSAVVSPDQQLRAMQTQLAMLEGRYSPDHPDVMRTRRDVEALKAQLGTDVDLSTRAQALSQARTDLAKAEEQYTPDHPEVQRLRRMVASLEAQSREPSGRNLGSLDADNPAYVQVKGQREALDIEEISLRQKRAELGRRITQAENNILRSSDVEKNLSGLGRRLITANNSYQAARERLFAAQLGQALETQSKGERFALVEPPDLPLQPSSPNRPVLLALLLVLTLAAALGWPQVAETMDPAIHSSRLIERIQGAPPIAEIPLITTEADKRHVRVVRAGVLGVIPIVIAVVLVLFHFLVRPLDVVWYQLMRGFGM